MVWIKRAWFVACLSAHAARGDAVGVDPDLKRDHSTDEIGVEIANVALMSDKPCKVIKIPGCRRAVESRDLLGDVLFQPHHLKLWQRWYAVRDMDRHPNPAAANRLEPRWRRYVELARQRGLVRPEGAPDRQRPLAPAFAHAVGERSDSRSFDVADKLEDDGIGVALGSATLKSRSSENRP